MRTKPLGLIGEPDVRE